MTKLLIVDDEPYTVEMLETFLRLHGFETVGALNGEDGLVLVKVERPALLILDLMLPDLEGFEVCKRIRSYPDTEALPILILSARADAEAKERALAAGANAYLVKPARFPVLLETIRRLIAPPVEVTKPAVADTPVAPTPIPPTEVPDGTPRIAPTPIPPTEMPGDTPRVAAASIPPADAPGDPTPPRLSTPEPGQPKTDPA